MDGGQFCARFGGDVIHPIGARIPVAGVAQIALDLVQHGGNPRSGGISFASLNDLMRGARFGGQSQLNSFQQILFWRVHDDCITSESARRQDPSSGFPGDEANASRSSGQGCGEAANGIGLSGRFTPPYPCTHVVQFNAESAGDYSRRGLFARQAICFNLRHEDHGHFTRRARSVSPSF